MLCRTAATNSFVWTKKQSLCERRNKTKSESWSKSQKVLNLVSVGVGSSHIDDDDKNATNIIILHGHDTNAMDYMVQVQFLCRPGDWSRW